MSVAAVVVAAGSGTRFGGAKQFATLRATSVAAISVAHARAVADLVILVVPEGYDGDGEGADLVTTGGSSRAASVRAGLSHCGEAEIVVVHDAARPLASDELFRAVVEGVRSGYDGVVPGLAVADTVKRVTTRDGDTIVTATLERDELVTIQTPQAFRRDVLEKAHASLEDASDDASLVERVGGRVAVVPGEPTNVKITHRRDVEVVAVLDEP